MRQPDRTALRMAMPLWLRLGLPVVLIIALSIGFISFLNYFNYQKTYRQLNVSRVMVIGGDLRQAVEAGLNFGLAPKNNTQLDTALSLAKDSTSALDFVMLTDETGQYIAGAGNAPKAHDWRVRLAGIGKETSWQGGDQDTYQVGLPYRNSFGITVGAVVLGYNKSEIDRATATMRWTLLVDWLTATGLFGLVALLGVWLLTRRLETELTLVKSALDQNPDLSMPIMQLPLLGAAIEKGIPQAILREREAAKALSTSAMTSG
jgi:hypothetical protein